MAIGGGGNIAVWVDNVEDWKDTNTNTCRLSHQTIAPLKNLIYFGIRMKLASLSTFLLRITGIYRIFHKF